MLKINSEIITLIQKAEKFEKQGDYKSALEQYDEAIKLAPRKTLYNKKELIIKKLNDNIEKEETITKLIKLNTGNSEFKIPLNKNYEAIKSENKIYDSAKLLENSNLNELIANLNFGKEHDPHLIGNIGFNSETHHS
jgi:hypothetical protein